MFLERLTKLHRLFSVNVLFEEFFIVEVAIYIREVL
jgi:hypothetical protein